MGGGFGIGERGGMADKGYGTASEGKPADRNSKADPRKIPSRTSPMKGPVGFFSTEGRHLEAGIVPGGGEESSPRLVIWFTRMKDKICLAQADIGTPHSLPSAEFRLANNLPCSFVDTATSVPKRRFPSVDPPCTLVLRAVAAVDARRGVAGGCGDGGPHWL